MAHILSNITVLDLSEGVAGPYASLLLGDMGANVIKVERPEGDWGRTSGNVYYRNKYNVHFVALNRNKRNISINMKSPHALHVMERLLRSSDIVISNFRPGVMDRLGLDYKSCKEVKPDIIYCTISAFGQYGEYAHFPGSDTVLQAVSGMMYQIGEEHGPPLRVGFPLIDMTAANYAVQGILLALYARKEGMKGANLDISLMNAAIALMTLPFADYLIGGQLPERQGNQNRYLAPAGSYQTADGKYITVAVLRESHWKKFCAAIKRPDLENDERFVNNDLRILNREQLDNILVPIFRSKTASEWFEILQRSDIICAPLNDFQDIVQNNHFMSNMPLVNIRLDTDNVQSMGLPILFNHSFLTSDSNPPPQKGEHTLEILKELNFTAEEINDLVQTNTVYICKDSD